MVDVSSYVWNNFISRAFRCSTPEDVLQIVEDHKSQASIVSFDVFDTLVTRVVSPPERSKVPSAQYVCHLLRDKGKRVSITEALDRRFVVERKLRDDSSREGFDWESHIEAIMFAWLDDLLGRSEAEKHVAALIDKEIATELALCIPVAGMVETLRKVREMVGVTLGVSDMYLAAAHVDLILTSTGYENLYDKVYVSSEYKLNKSSTRLYRRMLEEQNVDPKHWIHIGDNITVDLRIPRKLGGKAFYFASDDRERSVRRQHRLNHLTEVDPRWHGAEIVETLAAPEESLPLDNVPYEIGFRFMGPLFANFMHQVLERLAEEEIRLIIFPAREGFILKWIYDEFCGCGLGGTAKTVYAFLNRATVFQASCMQVGTRELRAGLATDCPTLNTLLRRFGLDPAPFVDLALTCGFRSLDDPMNSRLGDARLMEFVRSEKFLQVVQEKAKSTKIILERYLDEIGFCGDGSVAVVDVGWSGTLQNSLSWTFGKRDDWPTLRGLYLGFLDELEVTRMPKSTYEGLLSDSKRSETSGFTFRIFFEIFELALRAPHGTTVKLEMNGPDGDIIPVVREENDSLSVRERGDRRLRTFLQAGIRDYIRWYKTLLPYLDRSPKEYAPYLLTQVDRFLRWPSFREGKACEDVFHTEDFGTDVVKCDRAQNGRGRLPQDILNAFAFPPKVLWPHGTLAAKGFQPLVSILNLWHAFRTRDW